MKNLIVLFCLFVAVVSCSGPSARHTQPAEKEVVTIDTSVVRETYIEDTLILVEETIPLAADENFPDFFYLFSTDEQYQLQRIVFPIPVYRDSVVQKISEEDWKHDFLFSRDDAYTLLFNAESEMELEKDTSHNSVQIDMFYLERKDFQRYYFEKKNGRWMLEAINHGHIEYGQTEEDFFEFYDRFSSDSIFQESRLRHPVVFVTPDPDDEFSFVETTLDEGQWFAFQPPMTPHRLTNVIYGQKRQEGSHTKIVEYKGFGNGFCNVLHFHRVDGQWQLAKLEDLSD